MKEEFVLVKSTDLLVLLNWTSHFIFILVPLFFLNIFTVQLSSVQSDWVVRGHDGWFSWDPLPIFSEGGLCGQFWHGQGCPLFDIVHPALALLTILSAIFQGAPKDGFAEAVMVCDMPKPCKFLSLDSCQKTKMEVNALKAYHTLMITQSICVQINQSYLSTWTVCTDLGKSPTFHVCTSHLTWYDLCGWLDVNMRLIIVENGWFFTRTFQLQ